MSRARSRLEAAGSPRGLKRLGYRAPIALYRAGLDFSLGQRCLMLEHRARKSGETRRTVLEVAANHPDALYVAAAWKTVSDWAGTSRPTPRWSCIVGASDSIPLARILDQDAARAVLADYANSQPTTFAGLAAFMLDDPGRTTPENVDRMASTIPVVEAILPQTHG